MTVSTNLPARAWLKSAVAVCVVGSCGCAGFRPTMTDLVAWKLRSDQLAGKGQFREVGAAHGQAWNEVHGFGSNSPGGWSPVHRHGSDHR